MKKSLLNDIDRNDGLLAKGSEKRGKYGHKAFWHILQSNSFENFISSDTYSELSLHAQNKLTEYNEKVKRLNELTRKLPAGGVALDIQKIDRAQVPLLNDLLKISAELKIILEDENSI